MSLRVYIVSNSRQKKKKNEPFEGEKLECARIIKILTEKKKVK